VLVTKQICRIVSIYLLTKTGICWSDQPYYTERFVKIHDGNFTLDWQS